ncbi:uncharacterized protein [Watersipora subatra]|uniref:uncharacterized protein n=1 Tax=Watersipora subatra TaxID=2589382 RepID=UPI00355AFE6A
MSSRMSCGVGAVALLTATHIFRTWWEWRRYPQGYYAPSMTAPAGQQQPENWRPGLIAQGRRGPFNPCAQQLDAFLQCSKTNANDLNVCYSFNEALRECREKNRM